MILNCDVALLESFIAAHQFVNSDTNLAELFDIKSPVRWFIKLVTAGADLSMGAEPYNGLQLCKNLLKIIECEQIRTQFEGDEFLENIRFIIIGNVMYGHYRLGDFYTAIDFAKTKRVFFSARADEPALWNLNIVYVDCLLRTFQLKEARSLFERIEHGGRDNMMLFSEVKGRINQIRRPYDSLTDIRQRTTRSLETWREGLGSQGPMLQRFIEASHASTSPDQWKNEFLPRINSCLKHLKDMTILLESGQNYEEIEPDLTQHNLAFDDKMRELLRRDKPQAGTIDYVYSLQRTAFLVLTNPAGKTPESGEFISILNDLDQAETACLDFHDLWSQLNVIWTRALICDLQGDTARYFVELKRLYEHLERLGTKQTDKDIRAAIPVFIPGLIPRLLSIAVETGDNNLALSVGEFRRTLNASAANPSSFKMGDSGSTDGTKQSKTEPSGNYYSLYAPFYGNEIYAQLITSSGQTMVAKCDLTIDDIKELIPYADPSKWEKFQFNTSSALLPDKILSPLFEPIQNALNEGYILPGGHLCLALDSPINLMPLEYAQLEDKRLLELFSISRIVGYQEWLATSAASLDRSITPPDKALAIFCPSSNENNIDLKYQAFINSVSVLSQLGTYETCLYENASVATIKASLDVDSVVHINAHGYYPIQDHHNPLDYSGLLLAHSGLLPKRGQRRHGNEDEALITPAKILEAGLTLDRCHVTLCACVSGLSKEAHSGDLLGLEHVFRQIGAGSVLASHWDIDYMKASQLTALFYENWLELGQSRAGAFRNAVLTLARTETEDKEQAAWYAFSLFGQWN